MTSRQAASRFSNDLRYRAEDHPSQTALTPEYVLVPVREALGGQIDLDPCSTADNPTGATFYYYPPGDGAEVSGSSECLAHCCQNSCGDHVFVTSGPISPT